jgi:excisionase family DNA binding protein
MSNHKPSAIVDAVADDQLMSASAAAALLGVSEMTVHRLLMAGEIEYVRIGKRRKVALGAIREYRKRRTIRRQAQV